MHIRLRGRDEAARAHLNMSSRFDDDPPLEAAGAESWVGGGPHLLDPVALNWRSAAGESRSPPKSPALPCFGALICSLGARGLS